jgi:response regulator RpfG family c-di-GMP phosphodiesterase
LVRLAAEIARSHHEKYDGSGYPAGLAGEDIPLGSKPNQPIDLMCLL